MKTSDVIRGHFSTKAFRRKKIIKLTTVQAQQSNEVIFFLLVVSETGTLTIKVSFFKENNFFHDILVHLYQNNAEESESNHVMKVWENMRRQNAENITTFRSLTCRTKLKNSAQVKISLKQKYPNCETKFLRLFKNSNVQMYVYA